VVAVSLKTKEEYDWCIRQTIEPANGWRPNMLLDDGGDLTKIMHDDYPALMREVRGISEETTTGVHRLHEMARSGTLKAPAFNVNDSVTKSKFDNKYGCRHSLIDGINRATDVLIGGKVAVVCGYGDVGKGCAESLRGQGARVVVTEIDPICALQAAMDGYQVASLEDVLDTADIVITATGNKNVVTVDQMSRMKHQVIVANIGHFDNEIDMAGLESYPGVVRKTIKPQVDVWTFPGGSSVIVLSEGRLMNLGNATGHPSFVMSNSFTNRPSARTMIWRPSGNRHTSVPGLSSSRTAPDRARPAMSISLSKCPMLHTTAFCFIRSMWSTEMMSVLPVALTNTSAVPTTSSSVVTS